MASTSLSGTLLVVAPRGDFVNATLRVSGPGGFRAISWSDGGEVTLDLITEGRVGGSDGVPELEVRELPDGRYRYEAVFATSSGRLRNYGGVFFVRGGAVRERAEERVDVVSANEVRAPSGDDESKRTRVAAASTTHNDFVGVFDAEEDAESEIWLYASGFDAADPAGIWQLNNDGGDFRLTAGAPQLSNEIDPFTVTTDQRVGIGTVNPQADLHIFRPGGVIRITDSDACPNPNASWEIEEDFGKLKFEVVDNCPGDSVGGKLWIGGDGNVGIGTSSPTADLTVNDDTNGGDLRLTGAGSNYLVGIREDSGDFVVQGPGGITQDFLRIKSTAFDEAIVITSTGVGIGTGAPTAKLHVAGSGRIDGDVALGSSRALKMELGAVSAEEILDRLVALPLASWRYKSEDVGRRHVGPYAEDFHRLFGLGDGRTISVVDAQGVAFAAIQELERKLAAKDEQIEGLMERLAAIETRLTEAAGREPLGGAR